MENQGVLPGLVVATLMAGCIMMVMGGHYGQWIPILVALAVVCGLAKSLDLLWWRMTRFAAFRRAGRAFF